MEFVSNEEISGTVVDGCADVSWDVVPREYLKSQHKGNCCVYKRNFGNT